MSAASQGVVAILLGVIARSLAPLRLGVVLASLLACIAGAAAQDSAGAADDAASLAEADRLLSLLDQPDVRAELRTLLAQHLTAEEGTATADLVSLQQERLELVAQAWSKLDEQLSTVAARVWSAGFDSAVGHALLLLAIAVLASAVVARALRGVRQRTAPDPTAPLGSRIAASLVVVVIELAVPAVYLAALNLAALVLSADRGDSGQIVSILSRAGLWVMGVAILVNLFWSPRLPSAGLFRSNAVRARQAAIFLIGVAVCMMAIMTVTNLLALDGMEPLPAGLLGLLLSSLLLLVLLIGLWRTRATGAEAIRRHIADRAFMVRLAPLWPVPVSLYLIVVWVATLGSVAAGRSEAAGRLILSIVVPMVVLGVAAALSRRSTAVVMGYKQALQSEAEDHSAVVRSLGVAASRLSLAVWLVAILVTIGLLTWLYELNVSSFLGLEQALFSACVQVICIGLAAYVIYAMIAATIEVRMARLSGSGNPSRSRRLRTLLPLLRGFLFYVVVVMAVLISLSALGLDIGPLIAGAGIFGLAIGLGTQKLVTDIVSGIFFLLDDAFAIGDYIEVKGLQGRVESISIRSMKLRHHRGAVHTLPFGEIASLTNHSRDWVIVKLDFRVPADTDLALVKKIAKKIGQEIAADPLLGPSLLEPVKSQGVRRVEDNALIIGVKFKAIPGQQFTIRQQVFHKLRDAFQAAGIRFADRGVVVHVSREGVEADVAFGAAATTTLGTQAG